jgi:PAS domain-containing protein
MPAWDAAFAAAGGAVSLALAATLWALAQQRRARARILELTQALSAFERRAEAAHASAEAFDRAVVVIDSDGARLASGRDSLSACATALGLRADADADQVVEALIRTHPEHARRLKALADRGEPCDFEARGQGVSQGAVVVQGRTAGAFAWLGLSAVAAEGLPSAARFAAFLDCQTDPAWITGPSGRLAWANRAWLAAAEAESVEDAAARGECRSRGDRERRTPGSPALGARQRRPPGLPRIRPSSRRRWRRRRGRRRHRSRRGAGGASPKHLRPGRDSKPSR